MSQARLIERRNLKMASSAHAFVRGSTQQFYRWLEAKGGHSIPKGPPVWICGDCHVGNLGPIADLKGRVSIQIRDLDQTVIGNPNHDLVRLALSLASAARGSDLPGVATAHILENMTDGYVRSLRSNVKPEGGANPESIRLVMRKAMRRTWKHLARERLEQSKPRLPRGERFSSLSKTARHELATLFESDAVRGLVTSLRKREDDVSIELLDAAHWVKGCSSLGKLRLAVVLDVSSKGADPEHCLIDIKEAAAAASPHATGARMPKDQAQRVIEGARALSPALGKRMIATRLFDKPVFIRELMPQDLKLEIARLSRKEAVTMARFLAGVVGRAHARQMDTSSRRELIKDLTRQRSRRIDAPSWLWTSVVELAAVHEAAYLEHCRVYALS